MDREAAVAVLCVAPMEERVAGTDSRREELDRVQLRCMVPVAVGGGKKRG